MNIKYLKFTKLYLVILLCIAFGNIATAQSNWQAQWIWLPKGTTSDVMLARKSFRLDNLPQDAKIQITATSLYQLYVNGEYVRRGPARSAPHHQSYDILDLKPFLQKGENVLAVRVHYQQGTMSYHHEGRAGLLAQLELDIDNKSTTIITDNQWKVQPDLSWDNNAPRISRFQLVVSDRVDLRKESKGWKTLAFDDSKWKKALPLMRNVGWPSPPRGAKPVTLTPPWTNLLARDIPLLKESDVKATNLIEAVKFDAALQANKDSQISSFKEIELTGKVEKAMSKQMKNYVKGKKPLVIPATDASEKWFLLFDMGEVMSGMPKLHIKGLEGDIIEIMSVPFMVDNKFQYRIVDSDLVDRITLSGEKDEWEATYFKPTRYMALVVQSNSAPIEVYSASINRMEYPFEEKGYIRSNDAPWINTYMQASAKTIRTCTTDAYTDNYRERRQYAQTGYYAAMGNYWLFGDQALQARYLKQTAQEQEANGIMPAYAPRAGSDYMVIMDSNCLWIRSLRNYLLYSGDYKTVKELLPSAKKLMALLHSYTNTLGMIDSPPYAYWLDHARNDRQGANFCFNGHYLGALEDFSEVLNWLDDNDSETFKVRADLLRKSLHDHLWDSNKQLFTDAWINGKRSKKFSEHANAMALALKIADKKQAKAIAEQLLTKDKHDYMTRTSGTVMVTPAMSYFLHTGLARNGYIDESFTMFKARFDKMLNPPTATNGTLWEEWWVDGTGRTGKFLKNGRTRSDAQTESAFPPALFAEHYLGVMPTKPAMKEIEVTYHKTEVKNIESSVPTPQGNFDIKWNVSDKSSELVMNVPKGVQIKLDTKSLDSQKIQINGKPLKQSGKHFKILSEGMYVVKF